MHSTEKQLLHVTTWIKYHVLKLYHAYRKQLNLKRTIMRFILTMVTSCLTREE